MNTRIYTHAYIAKYTIKYTRLTIHCILADRMCLVLLTYVHRHNNDNGIHQPFDEIPLMLYRVNNKLGAAITRIVTPLITGYTLYTRI